MLVVVVVVVAVVVVVYFQATDPLFLSGVWEALSQMVYTGAAVVGTLAQETRILIQILPLTSCAATGKRLVLSVLSFPSCAVGTILMVPSEGCHGPHLSGWI